MEQKDKLSFLIDAQLGGERIDKCLNMLVDSFSRSFIQKLIKDEEIFVAVNHVMEEDHYIEWISICFENKEYTTYLKPGQKAEVNYKYIPGSVIYAYCNKHQLWKKEVE